jgi:hypothetical protein
MLSPIGAMVVPAVPSAVVLGAAGTVVSADSEGAHAASTRPKDIVIASDFVVLFTVSSWLSGGR